ncbi:hypothetical protein Btru_044867 [Bulinus truncatus]|nr:hypothetical protein Btru_044867 [Bulinus truncatus]
MASEDFPDDFDIIVLGTGLTETIVAAAFSRIGLKVLHLERNDYYGGAYSNFNFEGIENWRSANENLQNDCKSESEISENIKNKLKDGESVAILPTKVSSAFNIKSRFCIRERTAEEQARADVRLTNSRITISDIKLPEDDKSKEPPHVENSVEPENSSSLDSGVCTEKLINELCLDPSSKSAALEEEGNVKDQPVPPVDAIASQVEIEKAIADSQNIQQTKDWNIGDIKDDWRKYCIDISPKILFCSGELVDLLIQSDVARYCEFRSVSRVLTILNDKLQQVPCSRADVFSSKLVSLIEKRLMMKFLQFAADYDSNPQEYKDFLDKPFVEFLKSKKLTPNIQHYIQHAIAMVTDSGLTQEGLRKTKTFLQSLGRYGNTAFLFPLYGTGELPQAFSRLSAVFGGIYCLTTTASHLIADADNKCCAVVTSNGQRISCRYLITECSYLPSSYVLRINNRKISRAIFITDSSILPTESSELSLLHYVSPKNPERPVTVLELPSSACVCPKDTFIVHLTKVLSCEDPEEDFREVREKLFTVDNIGEPEEKKKPKILWSMYFSQEDNSQVRLTENAIANVLVTSGGGDAGVDLDFCVAEARNIFHTVCPDEEFLPKPPNPEDILLVNDTEVSSEQAVSEYETKQEEETNDATERLPDDKVDEILHQQEEGACTADLKRTEDH